MKTACAEYDERSPAPTDTTPATWTAEEVARAKELADGYRDVLPDTTGAPPVEGPTGELVPEECPTCGQQVRSYDEPPATPKGKR